MLRSKLEELSLRKLEPIRRDLEESQGLSLELLIEKHVIRDFEMKKKTVIGLDRLRNEHTRTPMRFEFPGLFRVPHVRHGCERTAEFTIT
jgi:hypothetical protein